MKVHTVSTNQFICSSPKKTLYVVNGAAAEIVICGHECSVDFHVSDDSTKTPEILVYHPGGTCTRMLRGGKVKGGIIGCRAEKRRSGTAAAFLCQCGGAGTRTTELQRLHPTLSSQLKLPSQHGSRRNASANERNISGSSHGVSYNRGKICAARAAGSLIPQPSLQLTISGILERTRQWCAFIRPATLRTFARGNRRRGNKTP